MRRKIAATALAGTLLATVLAAGASAQTTNGVTFEVGQGLLTLSQTNAVKDLTAGGEVPLFASAATVKGDLNSVTVNDQRGGLLPKNWQVGTTWTDFTTTGENATDPADDATIGRAQGKAFVSVPLTLETLTNLVSGTSIALTQALEATPVTYDATAGTYSGPIVTGATLGTGTKTFTPGFAVDLPADAAPGVYNGTVTFTVVP